MQTIQKENSNISNNYPLSSTAENQIKTPFKYERPGRLINRVELILHTIEAQKLLMGHTNKDDISLLRFAGQLAVIWQQAERDDPYADWYLLKVYDATITLKNQLVAAIPIYQEQLNKMNRTSGFIIRPISSEKPFVKSIWFKIQYGYLAGQLVAEFDELMRILLTINHVGAVLDGGHEVVRDEWAKKIIALFKLPFKWQAFEISRGDMIAKNETAKLAQKAMGKLPDAILTKKLRSPFAPKIMGFTNESQIVHSEKEIAD